MEKVIDNLKELRKWDGKPSWGAAVPQALQHVLAMLVGNITPPMLIASQLGLPEEEKVILVQAAMLIAALTTLAQLYPVMKFGMGLPNVMGVAFAYMPILTAIGAQYGINGIFGAQLVGAFVSIFIGMGMEKIRKFFPPIVSGTVVLSIGLSLYGTAMNYIAGGGAANLEINPNFGSLKYLAVAGIVLVVTLACNFFGKGMLKSAGMLVGITVGYIISIPLGMVDFAKITDAAWIAPPRFFYFKPEFHVGAIVSMILMYLVQAVQTIGDVSSTAIGGFSREATDGELGGAIKGQGICGMIGSLMGGLPTDPYSQNVGIIVTTKVVAKRVFVLVVGIIAVAGFIPKFGGLMSTIPFPVLGGATITVFASITMSGIQLITSQPMNYRNRMIVGIALAVALGFTTVPLSLHNLPQSLTAIIGSSPIIVAFLLSFILNIIVPKDDTVEED